MNNDIGFSSVVSHRLRVVVRLASSLTKLKTLAARVSAIKTRSL